MLQYAGHGIAQVCVAETGQGELALKYPTCPHPGINLLEDWQTRENT